MKKLNLTGSVLAGALLGALVLAACGSDDTTVLPPPDADAATDATTGDGATADAVAPPADGGSDGGDAAPLGCTGTQTLCGDTCVDLTSNGDNCGSCGNDCAPGTVCSAGACAVACNGGATRCGNSCVNLANDPANCGVCGATCATGLVCSDFKCGGTCAAGLALCALPGDGGSPADAGDGGGTTSSSGPTFCADESADPNNCGGCGVVCPAGQLCSNGGCATSCQVGLVECNGRCVDPTSNGDFCGATAGCGADAGSAGTVCPTGQVCTTGAQGIGACATTCAAGQVDCGGTCVDPTSDRDNCGAFGDCVTSAGDTANSAGVSCITGQVCTKDGNGKGTCAVSCVAGQIECGGTCIDPLIDPNFCGAVGSCAADGKNTGGVADGPGVACPDGQLCSKGACLPNCPSGQIDCGGKCVDPQTDNAFCGASGACTGAGVGTDCTKISGTICSASSCQLTCVTGQVECNGICVDPTSDSTHCGVNAACGGGAANSTAGVCPSGTVCTAGTNGAGTCATACAGTQVNCGGTCVDPLTSESNCGATSGCGTNGGSAGTACPAGDSCQSGSCSASCGANLSACGTACVDESNDPSHCGGCSTLCNGANALNVCRTGTCAINSCTTGFADCDGVVSNGCEVATTTDANNCGACGKVCAAGLTCQAGSCAAPRTTVALCGSSSRSPSVFFPTGQSWTVVNTCTPNNTQQAMFITRSGTVPANAPLQTYINAGGIVLTEYSKAASVWTNAFGVATSVGANEGNCLDSAPTVVQFTPADPLWQAISFASVQIPLSESGCGFAVGAFSGITPIAGWDASHVAIGYRVSGAGRVWATEFDWSDGQLSIPTTEYAKTDTMMGYMMTHR